MIKIEIDRLGQITSQIDQVRQGDKGVVVSAKFEDKDNINYVAKINLTRADGEIASGITMQPDSEHADTFVKTLETEWYFCKHGQTSLTVYLYKDGVVDAQGQVNFNVEKTDYDGEPTITPDQYDELVELIATKLNIVNGIITANTISALDDLLDYNVGQVFYVKNDGKIYQLNSSYNLDTVIDLYLVNFTILNEVEVVETKTASQVKKTILLKNPEDQTFYDFEVVFDVATSEKAGLMSASDKETLDDVPNVYATKTELDEIKNRTDVVDVVESESVLSTYDTSKLGDLDIVKVVNDALYSDANTYWRYYKDTSDIPSGSTVIYTHWVYNGQEGPYLTETQADNKYQIKLVSGTNIKTINSKNVLGNGDLKTIVVIQSASGVSGVIEDKEVPALTSEQLVYAYNSMVDGAVVFILSENDEYFVVKQANSVNNKPTLYFDFEETHILKYALGETVVITAKEIGSGSGAVESVNGKVGVVVLNASDLLATNAQTIQQNLERIDGLIDDANSDIEDLQDEVAEVRDIAQGKTNSYVVSLLADITGTQDEDGNFTSVSAITDVDLSTLKIGDNIFVVDTEAPDFWVSAISPVVKLNKLQTEKIDIENYYTKDEVDGLLDDKADVGDSYTKQETDTLLNAKANSSDVYSKDDADDTFATKIELDDKQDKSTARTITTATFNGGLNSNEFTEFTQPMTSLTIASLDARTGDNTPTFAFHFKLATGGTISFTPTIKWDCGNPVFEAGVDYIVVITKVGSSYFGALGEHY